VNPADRMRVAPLDFQRTGARAIMRTDGMGNVVKHQRGQVADRSL
jgi:hypothetical protein